MPHYDYREIQLRTRNPDEASLWLTRVQSKDVKRSDYLLSLNVGDHLESQASGQN